MTASNATKRVLEQWTERDLSAAALQGELHAAFEIEEQLTQASDVLSSGRNLLIAGEPGVGKTALVYELVRRTAAGTGPASFVGKRILQFSFRHRVASLSKPHLLLPELQRLVEVLCDAAHDIVPFFRDFHLAQTFDIEPQLQALGYRLNSPIVGEAESAGLSAMFEAYPELEQQYVTLTLQEPDLERAGLILRAWAANLAATKELHFEPAALDEALHLSHRFLARSRLPRKALDLLSQVAGLSGMRSQITRAEVIERFSNVHHVPRTLIDPVEPLDLSALGRHLGQELLGQPEAVDTIRRTIGLIKSGLSDTRRPFGVFLFVGPTGVGKTHAAQLLARLLFGSRERMIRVNMADYQTDSAPEILFGDPTDYRLPFRRGVVTQRTAGQPFAVLLLDEFEKAHEKVADRFLQLFDEGSFINGHGETIACRSMILIATSNIGADIYREHPVGFFPAPDVERLAHELERRLAQRFRMELLNRFDQVVHFRPLSRADVRTIAARELQALKERIGFKRSGLELEVDDAVLDWLAVHGYDLRFGARFLRRTLEREVTSALAGLLVCGKAKPGDRALLTVRRNRIEVRVAGPDVPRLDKKPRLIVSHGRNIETGGLGGDALQQKAAELLRRAVDRLAALEARRQEAKHLLEAMNAPGFWDGGVESRETLEKYRTVDVMIQVEQRYADVLQDLDSLMHTAPTPKDGSRFASAVESAAGALRQWNERLLEEGASDLWLCVERADPLQNVEPWLSELARMELAWCRRLHLEASVVACELIDRELSRVVLQVEGPGASAYLIPEEGVHRRTQKVGRDLKAHIRIVPRGVNTGRALPEIVKVKERKGPLEMSLRCSGRLEIEATGVSIHLIGNNPEILAELLSDLDAHLRVENDKPLVVARTYGKDGVGARDPRTGATVLRLKDALRGELELFLEAWRLN